jgi:hypothetical protein
MGVVLRRSAQGSRMREFAGRSNSKRLAPLAWRRTYGVVVSMRQRRKLKARQKKATSVVLRRLVKGAQANKTIAAFHRAEQASMAGGSRNVTIAEPPSEIASASAAHQSVGKPRAVSSRRQNRHQSGTRHYIRMKHPRQEIFGQPRAPDHQWHRA